MFHGDAIDIAHSMHSPVDGVGGNAVGLLKPHFP
jgi:hypothetical protein